MERILNCSLCGLDFIWLDHFLLHAADVHAEELKIPEAFVQFIANDENRRYLEKFLNTAMDAFIARNHGELSRILPVDAEKTLAFPCPLADECGNGDSLFMVKYLVMHCIEFHKEDYNLMASIMDADMDQVKTFGEYIAKAFLSSLKPGASEESETDDVEMGDVVRPWIPRSPLRNRTSFDKDRIPPAGHNPPPERIEQRRFFYADGPDDLTVYVNQRPGNYTTYIFEMFSQYAADNSMYFRNKIPSPNKKLRRLNSKFFQNKLLNYRRAERLLNVETADSYALSIALSVFLGDPLTLSLKCSSTDIENWLLLLNILTNAEEFDLRPAKQRIQEKLFADTCEMKDGLIWCPICIDRVAIALRFGLEIPQNIKFYFDAREKYFLRPRRKEFARLCGFKGVNDLLKNSP